MRDGELEVLIVTRVFPRVQGSEAVKSGTSCCDSISEVDYRLHFIRGDPR